MDNVLEYRNCIIIDVYTGEEDPHKTAVEIGIPTVSVWRIGERHPDRGLPKRSFIQYRSTAENWEASFADHCASIERLFKDRYSELKSACESYDVDITIVVEFNGSFPNLEISEGLGKLAVDLGTNIFIKVENMVE